MKVRSGFVSNSSSSSFVIRLDKKVESEAELKNLLFGDKEYVESYYSGGETTKRLSEVLFNDFQNSSASDLMDNLTSWDVNVSDILSDVMDIEDRDKLTDDLRTIEDQKDYYYQNYPYKVTTDDGKYNLYWSLRENLSKRLFNEQILKKYPVFEKFAWYCVEYEDHGSLECILESGVCFEDVVHAKISRH